MYELDGVGDVKLDMKKSTLEIHPIAQLIHPSRVLTSYLHRVRQRRVLFSAPAAGTSLSGPAVSNGILVDISKHWGNYNVEENVR